MFGINEILNENLIKKQLTAKEKFEILHSKNIDIKVVEYLISKLSNLHIEVLGDYEGSLFELMESEKLEGWCWQTTESAIVFLNDEDYIERGNLKFDERTPEYYHSWICFTFNDTEYVLDPCLNLLCEKNDYSEIFETIVKGKVSAKIVREELIKQVTTPKKEDNSEPSKSSENIIKLLLGDSYESYKEEKKGEVTIHGPENVNTPFYRNSTGYKAEIDNGKIKKLTAHYYWGDC